MTLVENGRFLYPKIEIGCISENVSFVESIMKKITAIILLSLACGSAFAQSIGKPTISSPDRVMSGHIAYLDISKKSIREIDLEGNLVWEATIPKELASKEISAGSDIEWLPQSNTFIVAIANTGFYEIGRDKQIITLCKYPHISHDIDKLSNGTFLMVNGWDAQGENEPLVSILNTDCRVLKTYFKDNFQFSKDQLNPRAAKQDGKKSQAHVNSIRSLSNDQYLISSRNYDQFFILKNGTVSNRYTKATGVHDPMPIVNVSGSIDGFVYASRGDINQLRYRQYDQPDSDNRVIWEHTKKDNDLWTPLRTVELLPNGNWLITGSKAIGQITTDGQMVWHIVLDEFRHQRSKENREWSYLFKATFVSQ